MSRRSIASLFWLSLTWACAAAAHHSFANIYDSSRSVTLHGVVKEFQFIHPHPYLIIEVTQDGGARQS